jgi:hypothetical protein
VSPNDYRVLGEAICGRLATEIGKLGFPEASLPPLPVFSQAEWTRAKDPFSGLDSTVGLWKSARGARIGEIKFHGDGSFYAEYDVALAHPMHPQSWFVEAVVAWGRDDLIKTEVRLLPALGA